MKITTTGLDIAKTVFSLRKITYQVALSRTSNSMASYPVGFMDPQGREPGLAFSLRIELAEKRSAFRLIGKSARRKTRITGFYFLEKRLSSVHEH